MIDVQSARARLKGKIERTPLVPFGGPDLRLKLECLQVTGSFKARGAWNHASQLAPGTAVVTTSSGNHGKALAWAARERGLRATIVMPQDAYANKVAACRELGAEVVLGRSRLDADVIATRLAREGALLVPPYDHERTIEGQGTVGLEIVEEWPEVEAILVPVGGGGLISGVALACPGRRVFGVEPAGSPKMTLALERGHPVRLENGGKSKIQGLIPPAAGILTLPIIRDHVERVFTLEDDAILAAQRELVRAGFKVEPAGAAAFALHRSGLVHARKVAVVVSGGNADPDQLAAIAGA
ncbi:MAG TPA: threonine/serine dehydratase [Planctomycetota bacterium]|nr:threonine/serine dehydratase [Planctomycetota bacterium]